MEKKAVGKGMKSQKQAYLFLAPSLIILIRFCAACRCDCDQHHEYQYLHE